MISTSTILLLFSFSTSTLGIMIVKEHRIVGGQNATRNEFPSLVYLFGAVLCAGTILDENWILTSATCITNGNDRFVIYAGKYMLHEVQWEETEQRRTNVNIVVHKGFNSSTLENDIAMIQLNASLIFTDAVQPARLPSANYIPRGEGTLVGWGVQYPGSSDYAWDPQKVNLPIIETTACAKSYDKNITITDKIICAGNPAEDKYYCEGDAGGALLCTENGRLVACGIATFDYINEPCVRPLHPDVYTKVSSYLTWINTTKIEELVPTTTTTTTTPRPTTTTRAPSTTPTTPTTTSSAKNNAEIFSHILFFATVCSLNIL